MHRFILIAERKVLVSVFMLIYGSKTIAVWFAKQKKIGNEITASKTGMNKNQAWNLGELIICFDDTE